MSEIEKYDKTQSLEVCSLEEDSGSISYVYKHTKEKRLLLTFSRLSEKVRKSKKLLDIKLYKSVSFADNDHNKSRGEDKSPLKTDVIEIKNDLSDKNPSIDILCDSLSKTITEVIKCAEAKFTIRTEYKEYENKLLANISKTVKKVIQGEVTYEKIHKVSHLIEDNHRIEAEKFEKERSDKQAPVPRSIANAARVPQAVKYGLPQIKLDDRYINPEEQSEKLVERMSSSPMKEFLSLCSFSQMEGYEIHCLLALIQYIREMIDPEKQTNTISVDRESFLQRMGYDQKLMDRESRSRKIRTIENTFKSLAARRFYLYAKTDNAHIYTDYQLFTFSIYEEKRKGKSIGAWVFSGFNVLQVLTNDDKPFRVIPIRPFSFIVENVDSRSLTPFMRLFADLFLHISFGHRIFCCSLSKYGLASGNGRSKETSDKYKRILLETLTRYGNGKALIEDGRLLFTPN